MKKLIYIITVGFLMITTSCNDYLDINDSPNSPSSAGANLILPAGQASIAVVTAGIYNNLGGFLAQYWTQAVTANQYNDLDQYLLKTDDYERQWDELFAGALNDLEFIKVEFVENEDWGNHLVAVTLQAYAFQLLVDLHDKVPYAQALNPSEFINPEWDNGKDVYAGILASLDDAINKAKSDSNPTIFNEDLLLGSNVEAWLQFARSLKLKILMRQSNVEDVSSAVTQLLSEGNFLQQSVAMTSFQNEQNKRNPWFEVQVDRLSGSSAANSINHVACYSLTQYLLSMGDPRLSSIYLPAEDDSEFGLYGSNYPGASKTGQRSSNTTSDESYARVNIGNTDPANIMILPEVYFLIAEAELRFNNDDAAAKASYEAGISASLDMHGIPDDGSLYGTGGSYEWDSGKPADKRLEDIYMQRWVAFAKFLSIEGWIEMRRTDYPVRVAFDYDGDPPVGVLLSPFQNKLGVGLFPNRIWYPESERSANINSPEQPDDLTVKVWWDAN